VFGGNGGVEIDTWVTVDGDCLLGCEVVGGHAEFTFGHNGRALILTLDEQALARFAPMACAALVRWQGIAVGEEVSFRVTAPVAGISAGQVLDRQS
jgi:hypothetical protein